MIKDVLYNFNIYVDGRGHAGRANTVKLPKLTMVTQEFKEGGAAGTIKVPLGRIEEMTCEITFKTFDLDVMEAFGVHLGALVPFTARGAVVDDNGNKQAVVARMRGLITECEPAEWKIGEDVTNKVVASLRYYQLERGGRELFAADPEAMILRVNGVDQLDEDRRLLGLS